MNKRDLQVWLDETVLGAYVMEQEGAFIQAALQNRLPERVLQVGVVMSGWAVSCGVLRQGLGDGVDVVCLPDQTAWRGQTFDWVVAAHELDCVADRTRWLAEMFRIVKPNGGLILTGFNPHSVWRWGRLDVSGCMPLGAVKSALLSGGWQIEQGRFMNYLLPIQDATWIRRLRFLEWVGNRWYPHGAAVYGLVARKQVAGVYPADALWEMDWAGEMSLALARRSN